MASIQQGCGRKRKRSEGDVCDIPVDADARDHLQGLRGDLLQETQIENEYENLEADDDDAEVDDRTHLKREEYEQIIKAQEAATITQYDDIKVTPFNLEEELEDGDFDKAGNFIFRRKEKEKDENLDDTWAESIDWSEVERKERARMDVDPAKPSSTKAASEASPEEPDSSPRDEMTCYRDMLRIMRPEESVQKTIRRLGNSMPKRRTFNKNAKTNVDNTSTSDTTEIKRKLDLMIDLAQQRLSDGDMNIYQKTYEEFEEAINT